MGCIVVCIWSILLPNSGCHWWQTSS